MTLDIGRRGFTLGLGATLALGGSATGLSAGNTDPLLFAYFTTGTGEADGLKLAISDDGFTFRQLAGGRSLLQPQVGEKKLMRDPFVFRGVGRDRLWHLLWTTAWDGVTIGHASTADFVTWSMQKALPVMADIPGARNCWAPEAIYDRRTRRWQIFWSSTVAGRFAETAGTSESAYNHRLWRTSTADFETFEPPAPLYDPGFSVIDGTFTNAPDGSLHLIVKDETREPPKKWLQVAKAESPTGPFGSLSAPFSPPWVEGPMTARIGDALICYYDIYRDRRWGAAMTRDMVQWTDVTDRLSMPPGARHGSLIRVPRRIAKGIDTAPLIASSS